jgi:hypothetical protein
MAEESHREAMSAAIRAQRERRAVPKTIAADPEAVPERAAQQQPGKQKTLLERLRGK